MSKTQFIRHFFAVSILLVTVFNVHSQVTIGSVKPPEDFSLLEIVGTKGGLRLPQLTTDQRDALSLNGKDLSKGLTIFNTSTSCVEIWNGDTWLSLCASNSVGDMAINPFPVPATPSEGGSTVEITITPDSECTQTGNFKISIVNGEGASILDDNTSAGTFKVSWTENMSSEPRSAIVRVTDPCGNRKDFTFTQQGVSDMTSNPSPLPIVIGEGGTTEEITIIPDTKCTTTGNFDFNLISGEGATVVNANTANGTFKMQWTPNPNYSTRTAVVRVTDPCGNMKNFVFTQASKPLAMNVTIDGNHRIPLSGTVNLTASIYPATADQAVTWSIETLSAAGMGSVDANGKVSWNTTKYGYITVKATARDGSGVFGTFVVSNCGANLDNGNWLAFMCHNIGVTNEALDPFTPAQAIHGGKYMWGLKAVGCDMQTDQTKFSITDWDKLGTVPTDSDFWNMVTSNPCPNDNWRVPTLDEWDQLLKPENNTITYLPADAWPSGSSNFNHGMNIGSYLFLPAGGSRGPTGALFSRGAEGKYWSSETPGAGNYYCHHLTFKLNAPKTDIYTGASGLSIRCVAK